MARRQPSEEALTEWSSVRVTNRRHAQSIHNSTRPAIKGRKARETILRDQRGNKAPLC